MVLELECPRPTVDVFPSSPSSPQLPATLRVKQIRLNTLIAFPTQNLCAILMVLEKECIEHLLTCKVMSVLQNVDVYHRTMNQWNNPS